MTFSEIISKADGIAWGPVLLILLVGTGIFLSIRLGFLQFARFGYAMRNTLGKMFKKEHRSAAGKGEVTPLQALTTALAATVGTGNIAGVTGAVFIGGPGAVFWMWISALVGMCTKYCEVVLAVRYRERNSAGDWVGGPMYYIKNGLGQKWKWLGSLFCVFGGLAAFGIGNATQSQSIASAIDNCIVSFGGSTGKTVTMLGSTFPVASLIVGIIVAVIVALVLFGGIKRIGSVTEKLVPVMAIVYILAALIVVLCNIRYIGVIFAMIFKGAFSAEAALGGAFGITIMTSIQKGVGRGCFSNEAGLGSAPMAHAASSESDPVKQGMYGIFEVFMDTIVICSLTCFTVLSGFCSGKMDITWGTGGGAPNVAEAIGSVLGSQAGALIIAVCLSLFALSTILSWSLYGTRCCEFVLGYKASKVYQVVFVVFVVVGATLSLQVAWDLASVLNALMAVPNLIALLCLSPVVVKLTREHFAGNTLKSK